jgi:hypothetical protein
MLTVTAYNEMGKHDITYGKFNKNYASRKDPWSLEPILDRGIEILHCIIQARTFKERRVFLTEDYKNDI